MVLRRFQARRCAHDGNSLDVPDASILRAAVDGLVDEATDRCRRSKDIPTLCADAARARNLIDAMEVASRLEENVLADELYVSVQRQIWRLVRFCSVIE